MPDLYISDTTKPEEPHVPQPQQPLPTTDRKELIDVKKNEPHLLAMFHEKPEGIKLSQEDADEEILLFLRRHYITNIPWQVGTVVFALLPIIGFAVYPYLTLPFSLPANYVVITLLFYYLIVFGYAFISFVVWFYNVGIVSNKRLIDIDINGISSKNVAATELQDILDISYEQSGFQQNLFDYGNVHIETEAIKPNFEFLQVPHPARVTEIITNLIAKK